MIPHNDTPTSNLLQVLVSVQRDTLSLIEPDRYVPIMVCHYVAHVSHSPRTTTVSPCITDHNTRSSYYC
jgi:hypothetical protein